MAAPSLLPTIRFGRGEWYAFGGAIAFALTNVLTRVAAVEGNVLAGTVIRLLPTLLFSLGMMVWRRERTARVLAGQADFIGWKDIGWLIFYGIVVAPLAQMWLFLSFRYGGVLVAVPFFSTSPLFGALIAVPFLGEVFDKRIGVGIVTTILGIVLLTYGQHTGVPFSEQWPLGALYGLLTGLMWALSSNIGGHLLRRGMDIYTLLGITLGTSGIVFTIILTVSGQLGAFTAFSTAAFWSLLSAGLLFGVAQYLLFTSFALTTVASASTIKTFDVGIATLVAVLLLGEVINLPIGIGILLIIGGILVVQLAKEPVLGAQSLPDEISPEKVKP